MATGIFRDPAAERAAANAAARAAQQGRVTVNLPASQRPDYQFSTPTQEQLTREAMRRGGGGLAGGGFWEGGDVRITASGGLRPSQAANQNLQEDPWANIDWEGLGRLMDAQDPSWRNQGQQPSDTPVSTTTGEGGGGGGAAPVDVGVATPAGPPPNQALLDALAKLVAEEEARIKGAGEALNQALSSRDPMAAYQWSPANVTIPQATLANYVQATGGSPAEVTAVQQLQQELLNAGLGDVGQFAEATRAAEATWRGRQQDVGSQLTADAIRQLGLNRLALEMGINMGEADRQRRLQDQALALALQYGTARPSGSTLNVTTPQLPFNTVNFPGIGNVYIPQIPQSLGGML